jgi:large conductance mechanosensitive channel
MGFMQEFKEFAMRGNVVDLAVGVVIGTAFGKIVSSLVDNLITPLIGVISGGVDFSKEAVSLGGDAKLGYGAFIQSVIDFLIVAFAIFCAVKLMNTIKARFEKQQAAVPPEPSAEVKLLTEIRDALVRR